MSEKVLPLCLALWLAGAPLWGCGDSSSSMDDTAAPLTSATVLQSGSLAVGVTTMTFEDTSRPTMANGSFAGAPSRTLKTEIWYPTDSTPAGTDPETRDAPLARSGRPYPLVIYSHGFMSTRTGGAYLARHLASHGYVVAAPDFPLSNTQAPGGANSLDLVNQPADVSFVIDQLLALSAASEGLLSGAIDADRIGLTGLSLGGATTLLTAFHPTLRDPRVRAAAPMAAPACFLGRKFYAGSTLPLLLLHGNIDAIVPYEANAVFAFAQANAPKYLVTILGGSHTAFTDGIEAIVENANNADDLGCRALGGAGSDETPEESFVDLLGGPDEGIIDGDCPPGCQAVRNPPAIRPSRQHVLTILSVFPFFEAYLRDDAGARRFLTKTLAAENAEVTVQSATP